MQAKSSQITLEVIIDMIKAASLIWQICMLEALPDTTTFKIAPLPGIEALMCCLLSERVNHHTAESH